MMTHHQYLYISRAIYLGLKASIYVASGHTAYSLLAMPMYLLANCIATIIYINKNCIMCACINIISMLSVTGSSGIGNGLTGDQ